MVGGVVLLLTVLVLVMVAVYVLRRLEPTAAGLAAVTALLLAVAVWRLPLHAPALLAGRAVVMGQELRAGGFVLQITPASQALLVFLLATGAATFLLAWRTYQGRTLYPFGLALLGLWIVTATMQPLTLAPFVLSLASILAVFLIQAGKAGSTRGAWRQMLFPTLAVPLFLVAAWYIDQAPLNPDDATPYRIASWLLIAGFLLLLQPAPLHVAVSSLANHAPPVVASFLWTGGQATTLFLLQRVLITYPWLASTMDSSSWLLWAGVLTAALGGLLAATQNSLGAFAGYAGVYDYGVLLVAMALRNTAGVPVTIWLLLTRTMALLTVATGAAIIRHHMQSDRLDRIRGAISRLPGAVCALLSGGFALAGMPLTVQFASRWALLQLVAENDVRWSLLLVLGAVGVLVGTIRAAQACSGKLGSSPVEREPAALAILAFAMVLFGVVLGLFPQLLTGPVAAVVLPLSTLTP